MTLPTPDHLTTASHWGVFRAAVDDGRITLTPAAGDYFPSPNVHAIEAQPYMKSRVLHPMVRKSFLEKKPGNAANRGRDEWVQVDWDTALDLAADSINHVYDTYGPSAVFGQSYGWKSSGAIQSAVTLVRRLLACRGGYVKGENNYSNGAMRKILPYVIGSAYQKPQSFERVLESAERIVFWSADPAITNDIDWFASTHGTSPYYNALINHPRIRTVCINPVKPLTAEKLGSAWVPVRPGTDTALMLGIIYALEEANLADHEFLKTHTEGWEGFLAYVMGQEDGCPKSPSWAADISGVPEATIRALAEDLGTHRTTLITGWGAQRAQFGEQFHWMAFTLAAFLGQIGLPGGGIQTEYHTGSAGDPATAGPYIPNLPVPKVPAIPPSHPDQGSRVIPIARFVDCIEHPGKVIDFNGEKITYPTIRLLVWGGGNPFTHQPETMRLERAWRSEQLEATIVIETHWTATAKHADIVPPATTVYERNDISGAGEQARNMIVAMHQLVPPQGECRDDYWITSELARRIGVFDAFTEGKTLEDWIRATYEKAAKTAELSLDTVPTFEEFWRSGILKFEPTESGRRFVDFEDFRNDPVGHPLQTPSGKIEIWSKKIESYGYADCLPHPAYFEPSEGFARATKEFPLALVAPKSVKRLHSQLDEYANREPDGTQLREPLTITRKDAEARGIETGDVVLVRSRRGAALARTVVENTVIPGAVVLHHGAWFDPAVLDGKEIDVHGNPNSLTQDIPTSSLACGNVASTANVEVTKWVGPIPEIRAFTPPSASAK